MELDDTASILANTEYFRMCSHEQLRLMAFASERHRFMAGETLFVAGDSARGAYVLLSGRVDIKDTPNAEPYTVSDVGMIVGATALVLQKPRAFTATATSDVETLFVPREAFLKLARQYPDFAKQLADRMRRELTGYLDAVTSVKDRMKVSEGEE
jgi:CRP-like cAMP-binding protein